MRRGIVGGLSEEGETKEKKKKKKVGLNVF